VTLSRTKRAEKAATEQALTQLEIENHSLLNDIEEMTKENAKLKTQLKEKAKAKQSKASTSTIKYVSTGKTLPDSNACVIAMKKVFPQSEWTVAKAIIKAESGGRPNAIGGPNYNGTYDYGCFQINNTERALDIETNMKIALYKWNTNRWQQWVAYTSGSYRRYL
jgi:hypothetical protein